MDVSHVDHTIAAIDRTDTPVRTIDHLRHLVVSTSGDVLIVAVIGALDDPAVQTLDRLLSEVDAPVAIDLRRCTPKDPATLSHLDPCRWGRAPGTVCVVCDCGDPRGSCPGLDHGLAVFRQPADAVQAVVLADSGYGHGWS